MDPAEISCCLEVLLDAAHEFATHVVTVAYQQLLKILLSLAAPKEDTMASQALRNELLGNQPFVDHGLLLGILLVMTYNEIPLPAEPLVLL